MSQKEPLGGLPHWFDCCTHKGRKTTAAMGDDWIIQFGRDLASIVWSVALSGVQQKDSIFLFPAPLHSTCINRPCINSQHRFRTTSHHKPNTLAAWLIDPHHPMDCLHIKCVKSKHLYHQNFDSKKRVQSPLKDRAKVKMCGGISSCQNPHSQLVKKLGKTNPYRLSISEFIQV